MGLLYGDCEKEFFNCTVEELYRVAGEECKLYSMWVTSPDVDPYTDILYDEPTSDAVSGDEEFKFTGPYTLMGVVKKGSKSVSAEERGVLKERTDAYAFFARSALEQNGIPNPKRGDIVWWQGRYYDVIKVSSKGEIGDTLTYTKFECEMKRTYKFTPERRLAGDDVTAP